MAGMGFRRSYQSLAFVAACGLSAANAATVYQIVANPGPYNVSANASLDNLQMATIDGNGVRLPGIALQFSTPSCGSFSGMSTAMMVTDGTGVAFMPRWTPAGAGECTIKAEVPASAVTLQVQVHVFAVPSAPPVTTVSGTTQSGRNVSITLSNSGSCSLADAMFMPPAATDLFNFPPATLAFPDVYFSYRLTGCTAGQSVTVTAEFDKELPPTAQWWQLSATISDAVPHWFPVTATVAGKRISISGSSGSGADARMFGMVSVPGGILQDLWWSGVAENGWGMSLVQHRDVLFGNIFVYDANGNPTWYVMPSGTCNGDRTVCGGDLYQPKGAPFSNYDATHFDIGPSLGRATFRFADTNHATFEYTINGTSGSKSITRLPFGAFSPPTDKPWGDLWWAGSAQNGWGIAVLQQYNALFALWFTYDENGKPTWFVMPAGSWAQYGDYSGRIFRAAGPPWLGVPYDASRHRLTDVGSFRFLFSGDTATFTYSVDGKGGSIPLTRIPF